MSALAAWADEVESIAFPHLLCGDFNAVPTSDEIRMMTGETAVPVAGRVFYDAWAMAGDGGPGHSWDNANSWTAGVTMRICAITCIIVVRA